MKLYRIAEIAYIVVAILATIEAVNNWSSDRNRAYLFIGFAVVSTFMVFFKRRYRKKFEQHKKNK